VDQWPDSASTDHGGVEGTHEHSYMKILRPSQYTKVPADREYLPSGAVRHRRAFGGLGPFHGERSFGADAALVWVQYGINSLVFARVCGWWWGILWEVLPPILRMRRRDGIPDGRRSITSPFSSLRGSRFPPSQDRKTRFSLHILELV